MEFKDRLRYLIDNVEVNNKKVSSYRIGKESGVSRVSYENYMSGEQIPTIDKAIIIAQYFNVSISWLLTGKGEIRVADNDSNEVIAILKDRISDLERKNEELNREVGRLEGRLIEIKKHAPEEGNATCAIASGSDLER